FSQRITLNVRNSTLETVLDNIQTQTGYLVLYNNESVRHVGKIHANFRDLDLDDAMRTILNGLPLTYAIEEEVILIKPAPLPPGRPRQMAYRQETISGRVMSETGEPLEAVSARTADLTVVAQTDRQGF